MPRRPLPPGVRAAVYTSLLAWRRAAEHHILVGFGIDRCCRRFLAGQGGENGLAQQELAHLVRWPGRPPLRRLRSRPCRRTEAPSRIRHKSSWRASTPCNTAKASSLPVRTMPVVVQAAMSRRTLSKFRRHTSRALSQLREAGGILLTASSVGKRVCRSRTKVLLMSRKKSGWTSG